MRGDGDGWVVSASGAAYWGRYGAAGLLLRAPGPGGAAAVLLQHRAPWSHQGGTWGLPGGARDSHETPEQAAVREAHEEAGLAVDQLTVRTTVVTAEVTGWTYTTVIADAVEQLDTVPNRESAELRRCMMTPPLKRNSVGKCDLFHVCASCPCSASARSVKRCVTTTS